uniref:Uncharacterized protein n=1 Tax=Globodera rostochiensis TaxID=31243 RepID=A0A914IBY6_GLORO
MATTPAFLHHILSSFATPSSSASLAWLFSAALLFSCCCCCCCRSDVLSLQDYTCAKKGAELPEGFSLTKDDQLLMVPSTLSSEDDDDTTKQIIGPQIRALLLNSEKVDMLRFAVIIIERDDGDEQNEEVTHGHCGKFFIDHLLLPANVNCSFGNVVMELQNDHQQKECAEEGTICTSLPVHCHFPMGHVEHLTNARHFAIKIWSKVASADDHHPCRWKVIIDDVRALLNASAVEPHMSEKCWETWLSYFKSKLDLLKAKLDALTLAVIGSCLFAVVIIILVVVLLCCRQQRTYRYYMVERKEDKKLVVLGQPILIAVRFGDEWRTPNQRDGIENSTPIQS